MNINNTGLYNTDTTKSIDINVVSKIRSHIVYNLFSKLFDVVLADTQELKDEAHKIRFQVFCIENKGYEDPSAHPNGMESDEFDAHAEHALLVHKKSGRAIGTVRVIKANKNDWRKSFPLQNLCSSHYLHEKAYVMNSCEFSRLCISKVYRTIVKDEVRSLKWAFDTREHGFKLYEKPLLNIGLSLAPLGLIRGAFDLTMNNNTLNVLGIMETHHLERFERVGMLNEKIGAEINYHGKRTPFICNILEIFDYGITRHHDIWNIVSDKGQGHERAIEIYKRKLENIH